MRRLLSRATCLARAPRGAARTPTMAVPCHRRRRRRRLGEEQARGAGRRAMQGPSSGQEEHAVAFWAGAGSEQRLRLSVPAAYLVCAACLRVRSRPGAQCGMLRGPLGDNPNVHVSPPSVGPRVREGDPTSAPKFSLQGLLQPLLRGEEGRLLRGAASTVRARCARLHPCPEGCRPARGCRRGCALACAGRGGARGRQCLQI